MPSLLPDSAKYDLTRQLQACQSMSRRNGKVARLPLALREQINHLLDDGIPYKLIIEKLGPAGQHLNEDNLSNWRLGGYQDYLKAQAINDRARTQTEAAADLVRENGHLDPMKLQRTCQEMALLQYLDTMIDNGEQLARDSFKKNPAKFITLINACSQMSNANIATEKLKWRNQDRRSADLQGAGSPPPAAPLSNPQSPELSSPTIHQETGELRQRIEPLESAKNGSPPPAAPPSNETGSPTEQFALSDTQSKIENQNSKILPEPIRT